MLKPRYLQSAIQKDALKDRKMAFISGPRQVGKTTLGKQLLKDKNNYFSWDQTEFRKTWVKFPEKILENIGIGPILFDEIHKDRKWKSKIKGIYDTYSEELDILVTGSAKLDIYRKGNDSLLGRYIPYRLHPFSVSESRTPPHPDDILKTFKISYNWKDLMVLGGYPEPLLSGRENKAQRWSRLRLDRLAYEDTRDIKVLSNLNAFRVLLDLIPEKVGSLFSFNSLKEDVGVAYATVREWVLLSELLYYGFFVKPYSKGFKRSIRAEPKFYLYDILQIPKSEHAKRLENLTALHLIKICHFWTDTGAGLFDLFFVRDKEKREVDFLITKDKKTWMLVECKSQSKNISPLLLYYSKQLKTPLNFQLVDENKYDKKHRIQNVRVMEYEKFFSGLI
ncbi:MAG: AAA family ATPase [Bdellovibrionales bacterium]|nr:AAA family ATPase [Bdellovibrionales bacterium]